MKKALSLFLLIPVLAFAQETGQFQLKGQIAGLPNGPVKITSTQQQQQIVIAEDSVVNGTFVLKGAIPEPGLYFLVLPNEQPQYLYVENTAMTITGTKDNMRGLKVEGSQSHLDFIEFNQIFNPIIANLNAAAAQLQREPNPQARELFMKQYDSIVVVLGNEVGNFVAAKRSSYVSPFLMWVTAQIINDAMVLDRNYNLLDTSISKHTQIGRSLGQYIAELKIGAIGTDAIDFTQNDTSGQALSLFSLKGNYVLVDFWASWCRPCRLENPNLVKAYDKFKHKNFTILGVSLDQQKEAWLKAIKADKLDWKHVSDLQYWDNAAAKLYRISSIPGNFLMDPNGKIIAKDLRGEDLEKILTQHLGAPTTQVKEPAKKEMKKTGNDPKNKKATS